MITDTSEMKYELQAVHRIKEGVDYSIIESAQGRVLTCAAAYFDTILELAKNHGVAFRAAFMYDERRW